MRHLHSSMDAGWGDTIDDIEDEDGSAKYYAVARGETIGLYDSWYGDNGAQIQTNGFRDAKF